MAAEGELAKLYVEFAEKGIGAVNAATDSMRSRLEGLEKLNKSGGFTTMFMEQVGLSKQLAAEQSKLVTIEKTLYDTDPYKLYVAEIVAGAKQRQNAEGKRGVIHAQASVDYGKSDAGQKAMQEQVGWAKQLGSLQGQGALQATQAEAKWLGTGAGKKYLQEQIGLSKAFVVAQKQIRWETLVAEQGKFNAALTVTREKLDVVGSVSARVFAVGTAGIMGFVAAASPHAFATLTGSFHLLASAIGETFLPLVVQVSYAIQQAADWVRDLSREQKDQIAKWITWGLAAAGIAMMLPKVLAGVQLLTTGLTVLKAAVLALNMSTGGLLLGLGILVGVVSNFIKAGDESEGMLGRIQTAVQPLVSAFEALYKAGSELFAALQPVFEEIGAIVTGVLVPALIQVIEFITGIVEVVADVMGSFGGFLPMLVKLGAVLLIAHGGGLLLKAMFMGIIAPILKMAFAAVTGAAGFTTLGTAIKGATSAMLGFMASNPLTVIFAIVGGIMALSGAFGGVSDKIEKAQARIAELEALLEKLEAGGKAEKKDTRTVLSVQEMQEYNKAKGDPKKQVDILKRIHKEAQAELDNIDEKANEAKALRLEQRLAQAEKMGHAKAMIERKQAFEEAFGKKKADEFDTFEKQDAKKRKETADLIRQPLVRAKARVAFAGKAAAQGGIGAKAKKPLLTANRLQASMGSVDQAWRRIQVAAASGGTLEQKQLEETIRLNEEFQKQADNVKSILEFIRGLRFGGR